MITNLIVSGSSWSSARDELVLSCVEDQICEYSENIINH